MSLQLLGPTQNQIAEILGIITADTVQSGKPKAWTPSLLQQGKFSGDRRVDFINNLPHDQRFLLHDLLVFKVPRAYEHDQQLDNCWLTGFEASYHRRKLPKESIKQASHKLLPGKEYLVRLLSFSQLDAAECLAFLSNQRASLVGAHGISLIQSIHPGLLPFEDNYFMVISLDEEKNLWCSVPGRPGWPVDLRETGNKLIPCLEKEYSSLHQSYLSFNNLKDRYFTYLLCFNEL